MDSKKLAEELIEILRDRTNGTPYACVLIVTDTHKPTDCALAADMDDTDVIEVLNVAAESLTRELKFYVEVEQKQPN